MIRRFGVVGLLGLCSIAGAHAQSVTLYGIVDAAIQYARTTGTSVARVESSAVAPSRWGLTGTEDLGNGLAAVFKLENGFNVDTGSIAGNGALFNREAWVGLRSNTLGQVQLGNVYTPLFSTYVTYSMGELNTLGWGNATNNFVFVPVARTANGLRYNSPDMGGATVRALYALGSEGAAGLPRTLGDTASLGINYKLGNFSIDADYLQQKFAASAPATASTTTHTGRYYLIGASYDFDFIKPAFLYQMHRNADGVASSNAGSFATPNADFYEIDALIRHLGAGTVLVSFGQYRLKSSSAGNATSYALRYDYPMSKRTGVYFGGSFLKNNSTASFTISNAAGPGVPVSAGHNITSVITGIIHRF